MSQAWMTWPDTDYMSEAQRDAVIDGMCEALVSEAEEYLYYLATGDIR